MQLQKPMLKPVFCTLTPRQIRRGTHLLEEALTQAYPYKTASVKASNPAALRSLVFKFGWHSATLYKVQLALRTCKAET